MGDETDGVGHAVIMSPEKVSKERSEEVWKAKGSEYG